METSNGLESEPKLLKKAQDLLVAASNRFMQILILAPIGMKAKKGADHEDDEKSYAKNQVVPDWADNLGPRADDSDGQKLEKELNRATRDRNLTAAEGYRIEIETAALIRAAEDMLSFNRKLKEAWLFGKLNTLGQLSAEKQTDEHARVVADLLPKVVNGMEVESESGE